jgi:hypothetical protein
VRRKSDALVRIVAARERVDERRARRRVERRLVARARVVLEPARRADARRDLVIILEPQALRGDAFVLVEEHGGCVEESCGDVEIERWR